LKTLYPTTITKTYVLVKKDLNAITQNQNLFHLLEGFYFSTLN